jgi:homoserine O-succinyltransferase
MAIYWDTPLAGPHGWATAGESDRVSQGALGASDGNCLEIGLINNMPDAALEATERQFLALLEAAADGMDVRLRVYALPEVPRTDRGRRHVDETYLPIGELWDSALDGLIVTGTEPLAQDLVDEPYWESLTRLVDWTELNTYSSVWSCLAAHAAVLHLDGVARRRLADKRFGVFECARISAHPLTAGLPPRIRMPHSRWNELPEHALTASGYRVLTRSAEAGVDMFVRHGHSMFVFFQGHPEYEPQTLLLEYRRDVRRFLRREREAYPPVPQGYFDPAAVAALDALRERALSNPDEALLAEVPVTLGETIEHTWRSAAVRAYRQWLRYMSAQKAASPRQIHAN